MLHVIAYFAKSTKVTQVIRNDTIQYGVCKSVLVFNCNYVSSFTVSETLACP